MSSTQNARPGCAKPGCTRPRIAYAGIGRPSPFCDQHQGKPERTRANAVRRADRAAAAARARELAAAGVAPAVEVGPDPLPEEELERRAGQHQIQRAAAARMVITTRAWRSRQLAVALGLEPDPRRAVELLGFDVTDAELADLAADAARFPGLTKRDPAAIGEVVNVALALKAIAVAMGVDEDAKGLRVLAEAVKEVQGRGGIAYTELRDVLVLQNGEQWTIDSLLPPELRPPTAT